MQVPFERSRRVDRSMLPRLWTAAAILAAGCLGSRSPLQVEETDEALAALMEDGKLPDPMQPPPVAPRPPRFCPGVGGIGGPPIGGTGGSVGSADGGIRVPIPVPSGPPVSGAAGGSGSAGPDGGFPGDGGVGPVKLDGSVPGPGGSNPFCASVPIGFWRFDDCTTLRTDLQDSSSQR